MNSAADGVPLECQKIVVRGVDPDDLKNSGSQCVRKSVFMPRKNGKDNDGLSVTVVRPNVLTFLRQNLDAPEKQAVTLHVGSIREIHMDEYSLDVKSNPVQNDPHHALITGFPPRAPAESAKDKLIWNRFAELLAKHARLYPSESSVT